MTTSSEKTIVLVVIIVVCAILIKILLERMWFPLLIVAILYGCYLNYKNKKPPET